MNLREVLTHSIFSQGCKTLLALTVEPGDQAPAMPPAAIPTPQSWLAQGRASRRLVLVVVFVALLLDNMLLTVVGRVSTAGMAAGSWRSVLGTSMGTGLGMGVGTGVGMGVGACQGRAAGTGSETAMGTAMGKDGGRSFQASTLR